MAASREAVRDVPAVPRREPGRAPWPGASRPSPRILVAELGRSGLRGRGGSGSPTALKWRAVAGHPASTRVVVMNAAETEPGSFKDRYLIRYNPYAALEGLRIAAHVVGARDLYVATRARYRAEIDRLRDAIRELTADGVFDGVRVTVVEGPEEYLFGEEKALLNYIEEGQPLPREAHQTPVERGLFASAASPNPRWCRTSRRWRGCR
ncbi:MAG: hypothetical protein IPK07_29755 [Deltaproteobacteria bacterium]|nr:hypothetical protein [Deltaproteobacteria bacterium]